MLSKQKAAKRAGISATVRKEHQLQRGKRPQHDGAPSAARSSKRHAEDAAPRAVLTRADAIDAGGSGADSRAALIRSIGDNIDTRLQEITFEDDLDGDVFHERRAQLMEEARLAAGVKQRDVSTAVRHYLGHQTELRDLHSVRIAHNCNSITCVAALGTDRIVFGDKSGKVYIVDVSAMASGGGMAVSDRAETLRRRKSLLEPALPAGIVSIAVSDTSANRPTTRDVFEKTTVDMSCPSYVAAGAMDGSISVWETLTKAHKGLLFMHKKPITGLRFRMDTAMLYSSCEDGTLRVWSVPQMMAVDKLFGHEGSIHFLDSLRKETASTVGEDGTMRFWKIDAATQQAYTYAPPPASEAGKNTGASATTAPPPPSPNVVMEAVAMLNEGIIIGGARDGSIIVFDVNRRRPLVVVPAAHGHGFIGDGTGLEKAAAQLAAEVDEEADSAQEFGERLSSSAALPRHGRAHRQNPNPITAVAAVPYADVVATASYDGVVRVWHVAGVGAGAIAPGRRTEEEGANGAAAGRRVEPQLILVAALPVPAIVNSLRFSDSGDVLFIAMAKEPRRGRWVVQSSARNGVLVVPLTDMGQRKLQGVGGEVEHIPAQLFGIDDNAAVDEEGEEQQEDAEVGEAEVGFSGGDLPSDADSNGANGEAGPAAAEEEDMFAVGPDGMLRFKAGVSPASPRAPATQNKKKKGKKSGMPKVLRQSTELAGSTPTSASPASGTVTKKKKGGSAVAKKAKKEIKVAAGHKKTDGKKKLKKAKA